MKTLKFLYKNMFLIFNVFVILLCAVVHFLQYYFMNISNEPIPSTFFIVTYYFATVSFMLFVFGKRGVTKWKNKIIKKIEKLEQKEKLRNLL